MLEIGQRAGDHGVGLFPLHAAQSRQAGGFICECDKMPRAADRLRQAVLVGGREMVFFGI
ncbi:hypothetical protein D3C83_322030 [compost metagenome]